MHFAAVAYISTLRRRGLHVIGYLFFNYLLYNLKAISPDTLQLVQCKFIRLRYMGLTIFIACVKRFVFFDTCTSL